MHDENRSNKSAEKKRWIHDPSSDLCRPLNCKKKEICLLEDTFTAVCVSRKELKKNGDIVVPKPSTQTEQSKDEDDDIFYDTEDEPESDSEDEKNSEERIRKKQRQADKLNLFMSKYKATLDKMGAGAVAGAVASGNGGAGGAKTLSRSVPPLHSISKPDQLYTYTPQDLKYDNKHYKYIKYTKYNNNKEMSGGSGNAIYSEDKERMRGYNEVLEDDKASVGGAGGAGGAGGGKSDSHTDKSQASMVASPPMYPPVQKQCSPAALQAMGNRGVATAAVHVTAGAAIGGGGVAVAVGGCKKPEVKWMFEHLDANGDGRLSLQELYDLEHDQREACLKPFLQRCDQDRDAAVSALEWCRCFQRSERPCKAVARKIIHAAARDAHQLPGVYVPECDGQGYYKPVQCHSAIRMCWCVDKHGVEFANTRTHGKPNCDSPLLSKEKEPSKQLLSSSSSSSNSVDHNSGDSDDEDDHDQDVEGSADHPSDY
nr:unnamed protein product [Callosobruchus analis]